MSPKLIQASHAGNYLLQLSFEDGLQSIVDFKERILSHNGIWSPLHNIEYFKQARIDPDLQTLVWPNGVDICPDVLYHLATEHSLPDARTNAPATIPS